jgi:hypothetical protein
MTVTQFHARINSATPIEYCTCASPISLRKLKLTCDNVNVKGKTVPARSKGHRCCGTTRIKTFNTSSGLIETYCALSHQAVCLPVHPIAPCFESHQVIFRSISGTRELPSIHDWSVVRWRGPILTLQDYGHQVSASAAADPAARKCMQCFAQSSQSDLRYLASQKLCIFKYKIYKVFFTRLYYMH